MQTSGTENLYFIVMTDQLFRALCRLAVGRQITNINYEKKTYKLWYEGMDD